MPEIERLRDCIAWIYVSFVERRRTPEWAIQVVIHCYSAGMSLRVASQHLERLGVDRSPIAIHGWVHKADLQPISTVTESQIPVDEKMIPVNGDDHWLYGAVDEETNEIIHLRLFPSTTKQKTRWFLADLVKRCQLDDVVFLVDGANYLGTVPDEDGYRFQVMSDGKEHHRTCVFPK